MAAFATLDWTRFDVWAVVVGRGIATIEPPTAPHCADWLAREGYRVVRLDFSHGIGSAVVHLGELFHWRDQFGYDLTPQSRSLDALRDGFGFEAVASGMGVALLLQSFHLAWAEDGRWGRGFLEIAAEHSLRKLAVGRRFLTVIVVPDESSPLIGQELEGHAIPAAYPGAFR